MAHVTEPGEESEREAFSRITRMPPRSVALAVSVTSIWLAVLLTSIFAPDLVSGAEQEHLPIASFANWFWGVVATGYVLLTGRRHDARTAQDRSTWFPFAIAIVAIWTAMALAGVFAPDFVTGDDPTRIPLATIVGPFAATVATGFAAIWAAGTRREE